MNLWFLVARGNGCHICLFLNNSWAEYPLAMGWKDSNVLHGSWCLALLRETPGPLGQSGPGESPSLDPREADITAVQEGSQCECRALASCHLSHYQAKHASWMPLLAASHWLQEPSILLPRPAAWVTSLHMSPTANPKMNSIGSVLRHILNHTSPYHLLLRSWQCLLICFPATTLVCIQSII